MYLFAQLIKKGNTMDYHDALWKSIKYIAVANNITCSGLARKCGLDATSFNHSKRFSANGQPRWISTETLSKVLKATNTSPKDFADIFQRILENPESTLI